MDTTIKLELQFLNDQGKSRTMNINQPALNLDPAVVENAMAAIAGQGIFERDGVKLYDSIKGARYVTRTVDKLFDAAAD